MFHTYRKVLVIAGLVFCLFSSVFAYSGGSGEPNDPYRIADVNDLLALAGSPTDYNKCFILTADINMAGQVFTTAIIAADTGPDSFFQGAVFTGTFDGKGHTITHFTISGGSNSNLGLFGYIGSAGSVKNLGLENCDVSGSLYVGGLVGRNDGTISHCYSTGSVSGSSGSYCIGGLAGSSHGSISNCYSEGPVSGSQYVGGLVGVNASSISNCYSTGTVSGSLGVGGLVGYNMFGSISNCYSTGAVSGSSYIGGLVGFNVGSIIGCYSTGAVSGNYRVGGLVGYTLYSYGNVVGSFWDTQTSGQTTSAGGTGKTTAEMKTLSTFTSAGWDFVDTWNIGQNQTYPFLRKYSISDLNYDSIVNFVDFALFAENWLAGQ